MSRSCTSDGDRGQTEPLAALVAVAAVAMALSVYGVATMQVLDEESTERTIDEQALGNVWNDIREDGTYEKKDDLVDEIEAATSLPNGFNSYVEVVTADDDGTTSPVDTAWFANGSEMSPIPSELPDETQNATRPIPVQESPGEVNTGTLRVVVWER